MKKMENYENKTELAYKKIKKMIHDETLTSYQPISENRLANDLQMSRTPIRSALKLLEKEGFIKVVPKYGVFLKDLSDKEANQLYDIRKALERFVIRQIINTISTEDIQKLKKMIDVQKEAYERKDPNGFMSSDQDFHEYFFRIYDNPKMLELVKQLQDRFLLIGLRACKYENRMGPSIQEHTQLLEALEKKNLEEALNQVTRNIKLR